MPSKRKKPQTAPSFTDPKPCPFCGKAEVKVRYDEAQNANWVSCTHCYAGGPVFGDLQTAISAWNAPAAELERIKQAVLSHGESITEIITGPSWL